LGVKERGIQVLKFEYFLSQAVVDREKDNSMLLVWFWSNTNRNRAGNVKYLERGEEKTKRDKCDFVVRTYALE